MSSSGGDIAISVRGLSKSYTIVHDQERHVTLAESMLSRLRRPLRRPRTETFWALKDVSFDVRRGDVVGIIGRNGAGKSTLLKILSRITEPTEGRIDLYGRVGSLLEVGTGFHPELTGRENIFLNGAILGMSKAEIRKQFDAIVDFAGVEKFLDTPVKRYSSGMYVRLAFAVAAHLESEILIVDEVLAVGDAEFQGKCLGKMKDVASGGRTVLFVSHQMQAIRMLCQSAILLDQGQLMLHESAGPVIREYLSHTCSANDSAANRHRRSGTGELRFTCVAATKNMYDGGEPIQINFTIRRERDNPPSKFFIAAVVRDHLGAVIVHCDSRMVGVWVDTHDAYRGRFTLRTPWLRPGRYSVEMTICNSGVIDRLEMRDLIAVSALLPYPAPNNDEATKLGVVFGDFEYGDLNEQDGALQATHL